VNAPRIRTAKKPLVSAWTSVLLETGPAVDGSALGWLERNFRLLSTIGAGRFMHLAFEALSIRHFYSPPFFRIQTQKQLNCFLEGPLRKPNVSLLPQRKRLNSVGFRPQIATIHSVQRCKSPLRTVPGGRMPSQLHAAQELKFSPKPKLGQFNHLWPFKHDQSFATLKFGFLTSLCQPLPTMFLPHFSHCLISIETITLPLDNFINFNP
jgi:hypothetical protein